jgi:hypothetical protein
MKTVRFVMLLAAALLLASSVMACEVALEVPPFACKLGVASVTATPVAGATYAWSVEGASIAGVAGTNKLLLNMGSGPAVRVSVTTTTASCTATSSAEIPLRDALAIRELKATASAAGKPVTVSWSYASGDAVSQVLTGTDFPTPVAIPKGQTTYTYTPASSGVKQLELIAATAATAPPQQTTTRSRSRSAGQTLASASGCGTARSAASYEVGSCGLTASIAAPADVVTGAAFTASVDLEPGTTATWRIVNGTPATAKGARVLVVAGVTGPLTLNVTVERAGTCATTATHTVDVQEPPSCADPTAIVAVIEENCDRAVLAAYFNGRAPFEGTWSDGVGFSTSEPVLIRPVTTTGTYTIAQFTDAVCAGTVAGEGKVEKFRPHGRIVYVGPRCGRARLRAEFVGTPPFRGTWAHNAQYFETMESSMEMDVEGEGQYGIYNFADAYCEGALDNVAEVLPVPKAHVTGGSNTCEVNRSQTAFASVEGLPPYTVEWSDGVIQTEVNYQAVLRNVLAEGTTTVTLVSARNRDCQAEIIQPSVSVSWLRSPLVQLEKFGVCVGDEASAVLMVPPYEGAAIVWNVENGAITGGQGTDRITFTGNAGGSKVTCTLALPDGCSASHEQTQRVWVTPATPSMTLDKPKVKVGEKVILTIVTDDNIEAYSYGPSVGNLETLGCTGRTCRNEYVASQPGVVKFTLDYLGRCGARGTASIDLLVE